MRGATAPGARCKFSSVPAVQIPDKRTGRSHGQGRGVRRERAKGNGLRRLHGALRTSIYLLCLQRQGRSAALVRLCIRPHRPALLGAIRKRAFGSAQRGENVLGGRTQDLREELEDHEAEDGREVDLPHERRDEVAEQVQIRVRNLRCGAAQRMRPASMAAGGRQTLLRA